MFSGIATKVDVPIIFGRVAPDPYELCDLTDRQIEWLRSNTEHDRAHLLNFCKLFDFAACLIPMSGRDPVPEDARSMLRLSASQTQCAAATLCASFDERGAAQSALLAAELSMKAALIRAGTGESELRHLGHNLIDLARTVGWTYPVFEMEEAI